MVSVEGPGGGPLTGDEEEQGEGGAEEAVPEEEEEREGEDEEDGAEEAVPEEEEEEEEDGDDDGGATRERVEPVRTEGVQVAASSDGATVNVLVPVTRIRVTVRRDYPLRQGERLGEWGWSGPDGTARQLPQAWALAQAEDSGVVPAAGVELECEDDREIIGWGIGGPTRGRPTRRNAGQNTTDRAQPVEATVRLRSESGQLLAEGSTSGREGECELVTAAATGLFDVEIRPEHATDAPAGPGMSSEHALLYAPSDVRIELRRGRIVAVTDPYNPPAGHTDIRVGTRRYWGPTTTELPLSVKPRWWRDPRAVRRRGGAATVRMLILHCTGGSRMGGTLNQFFRSVGTAGANYIIDIDGHAFKMFSDDLMRVHAGVGYWRGNRELKHHSFGIEIINPNKGEATPYMARANPPYTAEQYASLKRICAEIVEAYPAIGSCIVGHSDVATGPVPQRYDREGNPLPRPLVPRNTYGTKRTFDPGPRFDWGCLEDAGLGMVPLDTFDAGATYGGIFDRFSALCLDRGDADPRGAAAAIYGREARPELAATLGVIAEMQQQLADIGYCVGVTGRFDARTFAAVDRFRRHFAREGMQSSIQGAVDLYVARRLHNTAAAVRAEAAPE